MASGKSLVVARGKRTYKPARQGQQNATCWRSPQNVGFRYTRNADHKSIPKPIGEFELKNIGKTQAQFVKHGVSRQQNNQRHQRVNT